MNTHYFTFGCGGAFRKHYVMIDASTYNTARQIMVEHFANLWAFQYDSAEEAGVERFGLECLCHIKENNKKNLQAYNPLGFVANDLPTPD